MLDAEALDVTLLVTHALETLGIPYVIGGSVASTVHGVVRTTLDVDLVADLQSEQVTAFLAALAGTFYVDEATIRTAIERRSSFNLIHLDTMVKIDVFLPRTRAFDAKQLERRVAQQVTPGSDEKLWVLSAEDVILAKLDWYRLGGEVSERQWRDVLGVIKTQGARLDLSYLRRWAEKLDVGDLLERAVDED